MRSTMRSSRPLGSTLRLLATLGGCAAPGAGPVAPLDAGAGPVAPVDAGAGSVAPVDAGPGPGRPRVSTPLLGRYRVERGVVAGEELAAALGDCNDDGRLDLVAGDGLWVQGHDGAFAPGGAAPEVRNFQAVLFMDVDRDGRDDLVFGRYEIRVAFGRGGCRFDDVRVLSEARPGRVSQLIATDVDQDGLTDLGVSQAGASVAPFRFLLARGDGTFEEREAQQEPSGVRRADGFLSFVPFLEDLDGDGVRDLFGCVDSGNSWFAWGVPGGALRFERDGRISDDLTSRDPMGVAALDFDRDGTMDYWVSGNPDMSRIWRPERGRRLIASERFSGIAGDEGRVDWAPYAFDADLDGWMDLLVIRRLGHAPPTAPAIPRLLINRHDGTFDDLGPQVIGEGFRARAMTCGDLGRQGRVSCFLADLEGLVRLDNALEVHGSWAGALLRGTVSDREAQGARIAVEGERPARVVAVGGQTGISGADAPGVLLAAGDQASLAVTVTWPSGVVQRGRLPSRRYTELVEPEVFTLSARVQPADGRSLAEITLRPAVAGAREAGVECVGDGSWSAPAQRDDAGGVRRSWRAPSAPGRARCTVTLDGVALHVHPVLRFL